MRKNNNVNTVAAVSGNVVDLTIGDVINVRKVIKDSMSAKKAVSDAKSVEVAKAAKADIKASKKAEAESRALKHAQIVEATIEFNNKVNELQDKVVKATKKSLDKILPEILKADPIKAAKTKMARKWAREDMYASRANIIYNSYEIAYDFEQKLYSVKKDILSTQEGEATRALIKNHNVQGFIVNGKAKYDLSNYLLQITYPTSFSAVWDYDVVYKVTGGKYAGSLFVQAKATNEYYSVAKTKKGNSIKISREDFSAMTYDTFISKSSSASGNRKLMCQYVLYNEASEKAINEASHGAYEKFRGTELDNAGTQKACVRINSSDTPSTVAGKVKSLAILFDDFSRKALELKGKTPVESLCDGQSIGNENVHGQVRPFSAKTFCKKASKKTRKTLIYSYDSNPVYILQSQMTEEQIHNLELGFEGKGKYVGKVVVIYQGNSTIPEFFGDLNTYKCAWDFADKNMAIPTLDTPKAGKAKSSMQLLYKLLDNNFKQAAELIERRLLDEVKVKIETLINEVEVPVATKELNSMYVNGIIDKIAPKFRSYDIKTKIAAVKNALHTVENAINNMQFIIEDSCNLRVYADFAMFFGENLLKANEIFCKDSPVNATGYMIKYPTVHTREIVKVKNVSLTEISNRINRLDITDDQKEALIDLFSTIECGEAVVAANLENMSLLAGMDYDYDMIVFIWDKEFVTCLNGVIPLLVNIQKPKTRKSKKEAFDVTRMHNPLFKVIESTDANVGIITNLYATITEMRLQYINASPEKKVYLLSKFIAVIDYAIKGKDAWDKYTGKNTRKNIVIDLCDFANDYKFKWQVQEVVPFIDRNGEYDGLKYDTFKRNCETFGIVTISEADKNRVAASLASCVITHDNIVQILADLEAIGRYDQEITIDSAKTSQFTKLLVFINVYANRFIVKEYAYEINEDLRIIRGEKGDKHIKPINVGKKVVILDTFSKIRNNVEAVIIPMIQEYLDEEIDYSVMAKYTNFSGVLETDLKYIFGLRSVYGKVATWSIGADKDAQASKRTALYYEAVYNMLRKKVSYKDAILGRLAYYVSTHKKNAQNIIKVEPNEYSAFMYKVCPKEALMMISGILGYNFNTNDSLVFANTDIIKEGDIISFNNGVGSRGCEVAVASNRIEGKYTLNMINDKAYASKQIVFDTDSYNRNNVVVSISEGESVKLGSKITICKGEADAKGHYDHVVIDSEGNVRKTVTLEEVLKYNYGEYEVLDILDELKDRIGVNGKTEYYHDYTLLLSLTGTIERVTIEKDDEVCGAPEEIDDTDEVCGAPEEIEDYDYSTIVDDDNDYGC